MSRTRTSSVLNKKLRTPKLKFVPGPPALPCRLNELPAEILRLILLEFIGDGLVLGNNAGRYLSLMLTCKLFHSIFSLPEFRRRMMEGMAIAVSKDVNNIFENKREIMDIISIDYPDPTLYRDIFGKSNPFKNSFVDAYQLFASLVGEISDQNNLFKHALPRMKFEHGSLLFETRNGHCILLAKETCRIETPKRSPHFSAMLVLRNPIVTRKIDRNCYCGTCYNTLQSSNKQWDLGVAFLWRGKIQDMEVFQVGGDTTERAYLPDSQWQVSKLDVRPIIGMI